MQCSQEQFQCNCLFLAFEFFDGSPAFMTPRTLKTHYWNHVCLCMYVCRFEISETILTIFMKQDSVMTNYIFVIYYYIFLLMLVYAK